MPMARNDAGDIVVLGQDGQWAPPTRATNPETGEHLIHDGSAWITEPPPARPVAEKIGRAAVMPAAGFNESLATTLGALPDMVGAGMRAVGLPSSAPGQYTDWARQGLQIITGKPPAAENTTERVLYGAGRGAGDAASILIPSTLVAQGAKAGGIVSNLAKAMAAQPVTQLAAGGVGGGVGEATGIPALGLAASMATPLAMGGAARLVQPVRTNLPPEMNRLAQEAEAEGINLTPGQRTGSRVLKNMEAVFEQLPFTSAAQQDIHQAQREAFNRASLARSGTVADVATPDVLNSARSRIGQEIGTIANRNTLQVTPELGAELTRIQDNLRFVPAEAAAPIGARLDQLQGMMTAPPTGGGTQMTIPGASYRMMDTQLGRSIKSTNNGDLRAALGDLRETLRTAMDQSISPEDAAAWQQARRQYANLMTTASATGGSGAEAAMGNVSPLALRGALDQSTGRGYVFGKGDQNDLARIGQAFLRPVPDSGTASRTQMQNLLTGGGILSGGAGVGAMAGGLPGAMLGAAASLGGPRAVQAIYNTRPVQTYLTEGIPALAGAVRNTPTINSPLVAALLAEQTKNILGGPRR